MPKLVATVPAPIKVLSPDIQAPHPVTPPPNPVVRAAAFRAVLYTPHMFRQTHRIPVDLSGFQKCHISSHGGSAGVHWNKIK